MALQRKYRPHDPLPVIRHVPTIARYTLLEALRNRMLGLVLLLVLGGFGLSLFLGQEAVTEAQALQAAFLATLFRLAAVFVVCAFIITSMVRENNDKVLELFLALPLPRASYLLGKLLGFGGLAAALALLVSLPLYLFSPPSKVLLWTASLACELLIVAVASLFCVITLTQILPAFAAVTAFYLLSRSIATLLLIGEGPLSEPTWSQKAINLILSAIAFLLPDFARFTQAAWLVYPGVSWSALLPIAAQSLIYLALVGSAALFDFYRKNL